MAQRVKSVPAVQEIQGARVQSLGQEDPLEEEMAIRSSILAREIPWTEDPGGLQSMGLQKNWTQLSNQTTTTSTIYLSVYLNLLSPL